MNVEIKVRRSSGIVLRWGGVLQLGALAKAVTALRKENVRPLGHGYYVGRIARSEFDAAFADAEINLRAECAPLNIPNFLGAFLGIAFVSDLDVDRGCLYIEGVR